MNRLICILLVFGCDDSQSTQDPSDVLEQGDDAVRDAIAPDVTAPDGAPTDAQPESDGPTGPDAAAPPTAPPNLLLVIADDLGVDASPCYAADAVSAPTIEGLCARGVVFENAWANPLCSPTRATLLSGQYGLRTGVGSLVRRNNPGIPLDVPTLPQLLPGYATACIGKWHLGDDDNGGADNPNRMGFDHFAGLLNGALGDYSDWDKTTNGVTARTRTYATTDAVDEAIAFVDAQDGPWLVWLAFIAPHTPFHVPPEALHAGGLGGDDIEQNPRPYYDAMIQAMDTELGRLLAHLGPETLANTHIVFIGDNGTPNQVARDRRRAKGSLYQGGIHVPLVYAGPASPGGWREPGLANGVDVTATLLDLAGVWSGLDASAFDGHSLVPNLREPGAEPVRSWAYSEHFGPSVNAGSTGHTARDSRYKYIVWGDGMEAFYDLEDDPFEAIDLLDGALTPETQSVLERLQALP